MPKWTEDQNKAIFHHGHDILVSAAAGSGKTTILIERIIEMLKNGENIDNFLVATFTEAAALEMKERLVNRIKELVASGELDDEDKQHLQSQIFKVSVANISTLHAFCLSVIKKFYYVIDLDPSFRLLSDETEKTMMQQRAFDNVRNKYYKKNDADFLDLTENFSNDKTDDGLADTVYKLYDFAITNEDTNGWLNSLTNSYQVGDSLTDSDFYQKSFKPQVVKSLRNLIDEMNSIAERAKDDPLSQNYAPVMNSAVVQIMNTIDLLESEKTFDEIREQVLSFKYGRAKPVSKETKELSDDDSILKLVKKQKDDVKTEFEKDIVNSFFIQNEADTLDTIHNAEKIMAKLVEVELAFIKEFNNIKTSEHVLDFNDLEHKAVSILTSEVEGQKIALDFYQNRFHEIMIDEYQDVNAMQENIIQLLSNKNNHMFMVGDIKQSIYGFRQAAPYIFTGKYQEFQKEDNPNELIQLSKNFRSSVPVDNFVNTIFKSIFDEQIGDVKYDKSVQLVAGTSFPDDVDADTEMYLLNDDQSTNEMDDSVVENKRISKIRFVAKKIKELKEQNFKVFDGKKGKYRELKYSDIAILARNKNSNTDLISYFAKAEIPVMVTDAQNYFQTTELQIMMSMLEIVDNPRQDIPLVAVLRSPIVGLNEEELAEIRLANKSDDYFTAMKDYITLDSEDIRPKLKDKLAAFFVRLERYRDFANKNSLVKLIWKIYQETGILEYVAGMPGGKQRTANLHALYQRANNYEQNNFKGLHSFIAFIQQMQKMDRDLSQPNSVEATDDTVKVMTIHASKGLEFPVVILLNIDGLFNNMDYVSETLFDSKLGVGINVLDTTTRANVRTIQRAIISDQKKISAVSEEMRLLYVALTRAKQKLILIGHSKDSEKTLSAWDHARREDDGVINAGSRLAARTYQNLIGMSTLSSDERRRVPDSNELVNENSQLHFQFIESDDLKDSVSKKVDSTISEEPSTKIFKDTVNNILGFTYQHQEAVETTAYQSVSEIKGLFADPDDNEMARSEIISDKGRYVLDQFKTPRFLQKTTKVSATDVGSATHLVLQKISLDKTPDAEDFEQLIKSLEDSKVIDPAVGKKINVSSLVQFYQSDLGKLILENKDHVSREYPFSILMPAKKLFKSDNVDNSNDDKILVHGIIDGVIELDTSIIVFDYKTDNVKNGKLKDAIEKYSGQLNLYSEAISSIIKDKKVSGKYLYFLQINQAEKLD
ncbi:helicase-exonuclease AddAB subunit AddA [Companilactobacillus mishanensis]|uniref:helicase-exonuclease AddAB subunit AddA n=1 Tax=Companilactobacillus mishanensis TaxID=2486008 RepID=UPI001295F355|nr:helicase-exonuclease AddAB subunit AddA [Companilactobacillus mishanensis]MQS88538.1 helicase-exonuclease AddAB subunit AddA [Companilactobacillus mishanensis]